MREGVVGPEVLVHRELSAKSPPGVRFPPAPRPSMYREKSSQSIEGLCSRLSTSVRLPSPALIFLRRDACLLRRGGQALRR